MIVKALDILDTHPTCPMRVAQDPQGKWYCTDCGCYIIWKAVRPTDEQAEKIWKGSYSAVSMGCSVPRTAGETHFDKHAQKYSKEEAEASYVPIQHQRPWWAGKDVVGALIKRGWKVSPEGLHKGSHMIPVSAIIENGDTPEVGADYLEKRASLSRSDSGNA